MFEPLESRVLYSVSAVDTSTVALFAPNGTPAGLDSQSGDVWLVVHALGSSKNDPTMQRLATAIDLALPGNQVRILDWSSLAITNGDNPQAVKNALATADAVADKL